MASGDHTHAGAASTSLTDLSSHPTSKHFEMRERCENQGSVTLNIDSRVGRAQRMAVTYGGSAREAHSPRSSRWIFMMEFFKR